MFLEGTNTTSQKILASRYLQKNDKGEIIESEEDMYKRVAKKVASAEKENKRQNFYAKFLKMMINKEFMPNTPTLINFGIESRMQQGSACFVLGIEDSLESILTTAFNSARIFASGGGVGYSFSRLRPRGDLISTTKGTTPGPIEFMKMYDAITGTISQGGVRRGASLGVLNVSHPDIEEFIVSKINGGLQNFNISVGITDYFMQSVKNNLDFNLVSPKNGAIYKKVNARELFDKIADSAWKIGDPGLIFLDTINNNNPLREYETIETCNPCGEQPLPPYGSCVLGHINLVKYVHLLAQERRELVYNAVRFLDNVISVNESILYEILEYSRQSRRIGLGVMGLADVLAENGIRYGSEESIKYSQELIKEIYQFAKESSIEIGKEKGNCKFLPIRNSALMSLAPTGTISTICGVNYGIEPYYSLCYKRYILDSNEPFYETTMPVQKLTIEEKEVIAKNGGRVVGTPLEKKYDYLVTSHDISYKEHIAMQAALQKEIDGGISKTINMPHSATVQDVIDAYMQAWESGCKGITIYRDKCRQEQVFKS